MKSIQRQVVELLRQRDSGQITAQELQQRIDDLKEEYGKNRAATNNGQGEPSSKDIGTQDSVS